MTINPKIQYGCAVGQNAGAHRPANKCNAIDWLTVLCDTEARNFSDLFEIQIQDNLVFAETGDLKLAEKWFALDNSCRAAEHLRHRGRSAAREANKDAILIALNAEVNPVDHLHITIFL